MAAQGGQDIVQGTQLIMGQSWGSDQVPTAASLQPEEEEAIPCPLDFWN